MFKLKKSHSWPFKDIFFLILFAFGVNLLLGFYFGSYFETQPFVGYSVQTLIILAAIWYFIKYRNKRTSWKDIGFQKMGLWKAIAMVIAAWLSSIAILYLLHSVLGPISGLQPQSSHLEIFGRSIIEKIGFATLAIGIAPIVEEILFRGVLLKWMLAHLSPLWAVFLNGILFAVLHLEFQSVIALSVIGIILAYITYRSSSLWPAIIYHVFNNTLAVFVEIFVLS